MTDIPTGWRPIDLSDCAPIPLDLLRGPIRLEESSSEGALTRFWVPVDETELGAAHEPEPVEPAAVDEGEVEF
jgi:hypothetical protein